MEAAVNHVQYEFTACHIGGVLLLEEADTPGD